MFTINDVKKSLCNCIATLEKYFNTITTNVPLDDEALKKVDGYLKWTDLKTNIISNESNFAMPCNALPNKIDGYIHSYLYPDKQAVVDKYYKKNSSSGNFTININKKSIPANEVELLINNLVLRRGNVVWVNFGFNIGSEFGGKHPALILKNTKNTLIVLPLSSQPPKNPSINVEIDTVYGFPIRKRWGSILRIVPVSVMRIDFESPHGSVKNEVLKDISAKIKTYGIK